MRELAHLQEVVLGELASSIMINDKGEIVRHCASQKIEQCWEVLLRQDRVRGRISFRFPTCYTNWEAVLQQGCTSNMMESA